jgi:hypothetical protein
MGKGHLRSALSVMARISPRSEAAPHSEAVPHSEASRRIEVAPRRRARFARAPIQVNLMECALSDIAGSPACFPKRGFIISGRSPPLECYRGLRGLIFQRGG